MVRRAGMNSTLSLFRQTTTLGRSRGFEERDFETSYLFWMEALNHWCLSKILVIRDIFLHLLKTYEVDVNGDSGEFSSGPENETVNKRKFRDWPQKIIATTIGSRSFIRRRSKCTGADTIQARKDPAFRLTVTPSTYLRIWACQR